MIDPAVYAPVACILIVAAGLGGYAFGLLTAHLYVQRLPTRERADKAEHERARRHRDFHFNYGRWYDWGHQKCGECRAGNERDKDG